MAHAIIYDQLADPEAYASQIAAMVRNDRRQRADMPIAAGVRWQADAPGQNAFLSPAQLNLAGRGSCASIVRAAGACMGFAVGVVSDPTNPRGLHCFLIGPNPDGSMPAGTYSPEGQLVTPLARQNIIDPCVARGMNNGNPLPDSVYQGAYIAPIWPGGGMSLSAACSTKRAQAENLYYLGYRRLHRPTTAGGALVAQVANLAASRMPRPVGYAVPADRYPTRNVPVERLLPRYVGGGGAPRRRYPAGPYRLMRQTGQLGLVEVWDNDTYSIVTVSDPTLGPRAGMGQISGPVLGGAQIGRPWVMSEEVRGVGGRVYRSTSSDYGHGRDADQRNVRMLTQRWNSAHPLQLNVAEFVEVFGGTEHRPERRVVVDESRPIAPIVRDWSRPERPIVRDWSRPIAPIVVDESHPIIRRARELKWPEPRVIELREQLIAAAPRMPVPEVLDINVELGAPPAPPERAVCFRDVLRKIADELAHRRGVPEAVQMLHALSNALKGGEEIILHELLHLQGNPEADSRETLDKLMTALSEIAAILPGGVPGRILCALGCRAYCPPKRRVRRDDGTWVEVDVTEEEDVTEEVDVTEEEDVTEEVDVSEEEDVSDADVGKVTAPHHVPPAHHAGGHHGGGRHGGGGHHRGRHGGGGGRRRYPRGGGGRVAYGHGYPDWIVLDEETGDLIDARTGEVVGNVGDAVVAGVTRPRIEVLRLDSPTPKRKVPPPPKPAQPTLVVIEGGRDAVVQGAHGGLQSLPPDGSAEVMPLYHGGGTGDPSTLFGDGDMNGLGIASTDGFDLGDDDDDDRVPLAPAPGCPGACAVR